MINKLVQQELNKVAVADLHNYDSATNTYTIPKKQGIKPEVHHFYLISIKSTLYTDEVLRDN